MKKIILIIALILLASCNKIELHKFNKKSIDSGFNTFIELIAYTKDQEEFNQYFSIVVEEFEYYNRLFDIYHQYEGMNNLKTINLAAGKEKIVVDQAIIDLLQEAKQFNKTISPVFDISSGSVLQLYHHYREQGQSLNQEGQFGPLPDLQLLAERRLHVQLDNIQIDESSNSVYISDPETSIDVGGIAKGFAAERIAIKLKEIGLKHAVINAGGNLRIIGDKPDGKKWTAGVQDPKGEVSSLIGFYVGENQSVVTSGNYQNFYLAENNLLIHHIIDLETLLPAQHFESVTVVVEDSGLADALSTTFYTLSYQQGLELAKKFNGIGLIYVSKEKLSDENYIEVNGLYVTYNQTIKDLLIQ